VRPALREEDFVWAQLDRFRRKVELALQAIREAREKGRLGVCYSGGKDSSVVLDLVRRVDPDAPVAFFDSGSELRSTYDVIERQRAEVIAPRYSMVEMARYAGWWGCADPVDPGCPFDAKLVVIEEPAETFVVRRGLRALASGLRAEESSARSKHARSRGVLYQGKDRTWRCNPISFWDLRDLWAYIASAGLDYNAAYDRMAEAGMPRESQRVATLLGARGDGMGRKMWLRRAEPEAWARLVREFPGLSLYA
jgi:phosphoadenosine phosphosulfate reductase